MKTEIKNNAAFEVIGSQGPLSGIMMGQSMMPGGTSGKTMVQG